MVRLYCSKQAFEGKYVILSEHNQIHYLCNVLRLGVGDGLFVFDGQGNEYKCQIKESSKRKMKLLIREKVKMKPEQKMKLTIACALPKQKNRFDDLIDKLSQLGVDRIVPMITERVILRWDLEQKQRYYQRWNKISQQACNQSGRNTLPIIEPVNEINKIINNFESYDLRVISTVVEKKITLKELISNSNYRDILILIGPEGDFTDQELTHAQRQGFIPVSLGDLVLRVDTAAIAVAALIRLYK